MALQPRRSAGGPGQPLISMGWSNQQQPLMLSAFPLGKAANLGGGQGGGCATQGVFL